MSIHNHAKPSPARGIESCAYFAAWDSVNRRDSESFRDDLLLTPLFGGPLVVSEPMLLDNLGVLDLIDDDVYCPLLRHLGSTGRLRVLLRRDVSSFEEILCDWLNYPTPMWFSCLSPDLARAVAYELPKIEGRNDRMIRFYDMAKPEIDFRDRIRALDEAFICPHAIIKTLGSSFQTRLEEVLHEYVWLEEWCIYVGVPQDSDAIAYLRKRVDDYCFTNVNNRQPLNRTICENWISEHYGLSREKIRSAMRSAEKASLWNTGHEENVLGAHALRLLDDVHAWTNTHATGYELLNKQKLYGDTNAPTHPINNNKANAIGMQLFTPEMVHRYLDWYDAKPAPGDMEDHTLENNLIDFLRSNGMDVDLYDENLMKQASDLSALFGIALGAGLEILAGGSIYLGTTLGATIGKIAGRQIARTLRIWPRTAKWFYTRQARDFLGTIIRTRSSLTF
jgi:hypothetical protein